MMNARLATSGVLQSPAAVGGFLSVNMATEMTSQHKYYISICVSTVFMYSMLCKPTHGSYGPWCITMFANGHVTAISEIASIKLFNSSGVPNAFRVRIACITPYTIIRGLFLSPCWFRKRRRIECVSVAACTQASRALVLELSVSGDVASSKLRAIRALLYSRLVEVSSRPAKLPFGKYILQGCYARLQGLVYRVPHSKDSPLGQAGSPV